MDYTTITIAGITLTEPVTSFTDIILAIISFIFAGRIKKRLIANAMNKAWHLFFIFMGISTSIGAVAHSIREIATIQTFDAFWMIMNMSSSISVLFALQATIQYSNPAKRLEKILTAVNVGLLLLFFGYTIAINDFENFKIHAAIGLLIIFITHLVGHFKKRIGSGWIVNGMLLSFLTVLIHTTKFSLDEWFNYKDISHVIMMVSLLLIYKGICVMSESMQPNV